MEGEKRQRRDSSPNSEAAEVAMNNETRFRLRAFLDAERLKGTSCDDAVKAVRHFYGEAAVDKFTAASWFADLAMGLPVVEIGAEELQLDDVIVRHCLRAQMMFEPSRWDVSEPQAVGMSNILDGRCTLLYGRRGDKPVFLLDLVTNQTREFSTHALANLLPDYRPDDSDNDIYNSYRYFNAAWLISLQRFILEIDIMDGYSGRHVIAVCTLDHLSQAALLLNTYTEGQCDCPCNSWSHYGCGIRCEGNTILSLWACGVKVFTLDNNTLKYLRRIEVASSFSACTLTNGVLRAYSIKWSRDTNKRICHTRVGITAAKDKSERWAALPNANSELRLYPMIWIDDRFVAACDDNKEYAVPRRLHIIDTTTSTLLPSSVGLSGALVRLEVIADGMLVAAMRGDDGMLTLYRFPTRKPDSLLMSAWATARTRGEADPEWFEALLARLPPNFETKKSIIPSHEDIARLFMS